MRQGFGSADGPGSVSRRSAVDHWQEPPGESLCLTTGTGRVRSRRAGPSRSPHPSRSRSRSASDSEQPSDSPGGEPPRLRVSERPGFRMARGLLSRHNVEILRPGLYISKQRSHPGGGAACSKRQGGRKRGAGIFYQKIGNGKFKTYAVGFFSAPCV